MPVAVPQTSSLPLIPLLYAAYPSLSAYEFTVAVRLLLLCSPRNGWSCYPSVDWIASSVNLSPATVKRAIKQLREIGMYAVTRRYDSSNLYTLQVSAIVERANGQSRQTIDEALSAIEAENVSALTAEDIPF